MKKIIGILQIIVFLFVSVSLGMWSYSLLGVSYVRQIQNPIVSLFAWIALQSVFFLICLFVVYIFARLIDKAKLSEIGLAVNFRAFKLLIIGFLLASIAGLITWLVFLTLNDPQVEFKLTNTWTTLAVLIIALPAGFFQAAGEELIFRSWALKKLSVIFTPFWAIIIGGVIFGSVHFLNPNYSIFAALNAALAGWITSLSYFRAKSIWMAVGIHFGWNYTVGMLYGTVLKITCDGKVISMFDGAEATLTGCLTVAFVGVVVFMITKPKKMKTV